MPSCAMMATCFNSTRVSAVSVAMQAVVVFFCRPAALVPSNLRPARAVAPAPLRRRCRIHRQFHRGRPEGAGAGRDHRTQTVDRYQCADGSAIGGNDRCRAEAAFQLTHAGHGAIAGADGAQRKVQPGLADRIDAQLAIRRRELPVLSPPLARSYRQAVGTIGETGTPGPGAARSLGPVAPAVPRRHPPPPCRKPSRR